jgi:hypothetical protein
MKNQNEKMKLTARRKLFTIKEELNAIVCSLCGERVEYGNEPRWYDSKNCMMTQAYQDITRITFQIPKTTLLAVIPAAMKTLQTTA